ncbi:MAG: DNA polymerase beta superfamily protein [Bacteroidia bacterium]
MNIEQLHQQQLIIFEAITGSNAYGTNLPHSDTDIRGVFILPEKELLGMNETVQVNDEKNDIVFYEIKRFLELVALNNPNILELLNAPTDCILQKTPIFDLILAEKEKFITQKCQYTFGGYAVEQIRKARGLNKKMNKSFEKERKTPLAFCWVLQENGYGSQPLEDFLAQQGISQAYCGLAAIPHFRETYALFLDKENYNNAQPSIYQGIIRKESANNILVSEVPKGEIPVATLSFNKDGYSVYCKEYKQYWDWVEKRNPERYQENVEAGKGYDGKNMMHCHRLLDMAIEIGEGKGINVRRPNREQLLTIRKGEYEYERLISEAEAKIEKLEALYKNSDLPEEVNLEFVNELLVKVRKAFYQ